MPKKAKKFTTKQIRYFAAREERLEHFKKDLPEALEEVAIRHEDVSDATARYIAKYDQMIENHEFKSYTDADKAKLLKENWKLLAKLKNEMEGLRPIYSMIGEIRKIREEIALNLDVNRPQLMDLLYHGGKHLPLWMGDLGESPSPRVGRITDDSLPEVGELVAAYVKDMWILSEVKAVDEVDGITIRDVDDEGEGFVRVSRDQLLLLPLYRADPKRHPFAVFDQSCIVLALYPQTTCFYKGIIESPPYTPDDSYLITFEDEEYDGGYAPAVNVSQRFVLNYREKPDELVCEHVEASDSSETDEETPEPAPQPMPVLRKFKMRDSDEISDEPRNASRNESRASNADEKEDESGGGESGCEDEDQSCSGEEADNEEDQDEEEEQSEEEDDENIEGTSNESEQQDDDEERISSGSNQESSDEGSEELGDSTWTEHSTSQGTSHNKSRSAKHVKEEEEEDDDEDEEQESNSSYDDEENDNDDMEVD